MSRIEFCQKMLREVIAPRSVGNVNVRVHRAAQALGWSISRTKDVWYADYRIRINPDEMEQVEQITGVRYARNEVSEVRAAISRADALLDHEDENIRRAFAAAMRVFVGLVAGTGVEGGSR